MLTGSYRVPGVAIVPSGLFDDPDEGWEVDYEQFSKRKVVFGKEADVDKRFENHPGKEEFERVMSRIS